MYNLLAPGFSLKVTTEPFERDNVLTTFIDSDRGRLQDLSRSFFNSLKKKEKFILCKSLRYDAPILTAYKGPDKGLGYS